MEKTIQFNQGETIQSMQIEQERINALAQVGALMLDLETAKKNLEAVSERRSSFIKQVIASNGFSQFESARQVKNGIVVTVADDLTKSNGAGDGYTRDEVRESICDLDNARRRPA